MKPQNSPFLNLPSEIRCLLYPYIFEGFHLLESLDHKLQPSTSAPAICRANRLIRNESLPYLARATQILIGRTPRVQETTSLTISAPNLSKTWYDNIKILFLHWHTRSAIDYRLFPNLQAIVVSETMVHLMPSHCVTYRYILLNELRLRYLRIRGHGIMAGTATPANLAAVTARLPQSDNWLHRVFVDRARKPQLWVRVMHLETEGSVGELLEGAKVGADVVGVKWAETTWVCLDTREFRSNYDGQPQGAKVVNSFDVFIEDACKVILRGEHAGFKSGEEDR